MSRILLNFPVIDDEKKMYLCFYIISCFFSIYVFRLSQHCRNLFFDLGSATIQNLKYRDIWALVGQKGIKGFSPYEEVCFYAKLFDDCCTNKQVQIHTLLL